MAREKKEVAKGTFGLIETWLEEKQPGFQRRKRHYGASLRVGAEVVPDNPALGAELIVLWHTKDVWRTRLLEEYDCRLREHWSAIERVLNTHISKAEGTACYSVALRECREVAPGHLLVFYFQAQGEALHMGRAVDLAKRAIQSEKKSTGTITGYGWGVRRVSSLGDNFAWKWQGSQRCNNWLEWMKVDLVKGIHFESGADDIGVKVCPANSTDGRDIYALFFAEQIGIELLPKYHERLHSHSLYPRCIEVWKSFNSEVA